MTVTEEYRRKLVTPEEAVRLVKSGDWVDYCTFNAQPHDLDKALAARKDELRGVKIRAASTVRPVACVEVDPEREHFIFNSWHMSKLDRKMHERDLCNYIPITFHEMSQVYSQLTVDVAMFQVCSMDERGFFNSGPQAPGTRVLVNQAKKVILEVNDQMTVALGGNGEQIHVSEVDYIVEGSSPPLAQVVSPSANEVDKAIAELIIKEIHDGSCIQLGIGALPNLIGQMIADSDLKHLGVHTEMLADSYVDMYEAGRIDGSRKVTDPRKMAYCFALGTQKLYDFIDHNPVCAIYPGSYTNNPNIAAQNPNLIAINNCLEVDLFGQVSSESAEGRHISGTGGQWDFIKAGFMSQGGKGIVCLSSTYRSKDGRIMSRIKPGLAAGTIATLPRYTTHYVTTEYGMVNLKGCSTWERAECLISIAHPDFREELIREAERLHIWVASNRK